jgi:hypothetical protein
MTLERGSVRGESSHWRIGEVLQTTPSSRSSSIADGLRLTQAHEWGSGSGQVEVYD